MHTHEEVVSTDPNSPTTHAFDALPTTEPFIDVAGLTDRGQSRPANEDCFITAELDRVLILGQSSLALSEGTEIADATQGKILAVADGMSAPGGGALASTVAIDVVTRYITRFMPWVVYMDDDERVFEHGFQQAFKRCQARVRAEAARHGYIDDPVGTTLTVAYIAWPNMYLAHAGDSRCYLLRDRLLRRLTRDDTMAQRMVDRDILPAERADKTPLGHILVNAIGGGDDEVDVEFHRVELAAGDRILLCTDGLTRYVSDVELKYHLNAAVTSAMCCRNLIDIANDRGGADNITAVVASIAD